MTIQVNVINAFSIEGNGGNPAGVVFDADHLTTEHKQTIAAQAGFPETAFVSSSSIADFMLHFFTPTKQIPHCGHATIATFSYLKQMGKVNGLTSSKETIDGTRSIIFKDRYAFMEQIAPTLSVPENKISDILLSLGISNNDIKEGLQPTIVNTGNSFLIVPVKNESILKSIVYDTAKVFEISQSYNLIGFYVYAPTDNEAIDATARMFAPFYGIDEEAATGMAAGPLACFLYLKENKKKKHITIEQGRFMTKPSPSLIYVQLEIEDSKIVRLFAGGDAYVSGKKIIEI